MSKQTFSEKMNELMKTKIEAVEKLDLDELFKEDEDFDFLLSLAYMTLSKEKIIKKYKENPDRLGRLRNLVEKKEINKVFNENELNEVPKVIDTLEEDNTWILDNIRDSIMHSSFEIDEENKLMLTNNTDDDRTLQTEIPFSWFNEYAKNDILSKKVANGYTVYGFYRNKYKAHKKNRETEYELKNNIPYFFNVSGTTFNTAEIENRIRELYKEYSQNDYDYSDAEKYNNKIKKYKYIYHRNYLLSFYFSSKKVKETIEKEYPGIQIKIGIMDRDKVANKMIKKFQRHYINYDFMMDEFDKVISRKGINLLNCLENIITKREKYKGKDFSTLSYDEKHNIINELVSNEQKDEKMDIRALYYTNKKILESLFLNTYGMTTLVINKDVLYNVHFLDERPEDYEMNVIDKKTYHELAESKRLLEVRLLESEIQIPKIEKQYNGCTDQDRKTELGKKLEALKKEKKVTLEKLREVAQELDYRRVIKGTEDDLKNMQDMEDRIAVLYSNFKNAMTDNEKFQLKKQLKTELFNYVEETSKFTYGRVRTMNDALTIIRNCFSHIGRITIGNEKIGKYLKTYKYIHMTDYDEKNNKSAFLECKYDNLLKVLNAPYEEQKQKTL